MNNKRLYPNINLEEFIRLTGTRLSVPLHELDEWCKHKLSALYEEDIRDMYTLQLTTQDMNAWNKVVLTTAHKREIEIILSELSKMVPSKSPDFEDSLLFLNVRVPSEPANSEYLIPLRKPVTNSNNAPYTDKYGTCVGVCSNITTSNGVCIEEHITTYLNAEVTEICKDGYVAREIIKPKKSSAKRFYL